MPESKSVGVRVTVVSACCQAAGASSSVTGAAASMRTVTVLALSTLPAVSVEK